MVVKILTSIVVYRLADRISGKKMAFVSLLIFATAPTVLFYSLVYYKEAVIQLLVATYLFCFYLFVQRPSFLSMLGCIVPIAILLSERFYLAPMLAASLFIFMIFSKAVPWLAKIAVLIGSGVIGVVIYNRYQGYYLDFAKLFQSMAVFKQVYNDYPDVDPAYNLKLPYLLGVIKIYFTPFFTLKKFDLFFGYSTLLTWGSFVHQLIAVLFMWSAVKRFFVNEKKVYLMILPYILFLFFFGYIAPYNGRLRDSFYPLLAIFAAPALIVLVQKIKSWDLKRRTSI
jgi:hypothetical protein